MNLECMVCGSKAFTYNPGSTETLIYFSDFTDENGKIHTHDPNIMTDTVTCSGCGAVIKIKGFRKCWCGWSRGKTEITLLDNGGKKVV